MDARPDVRLARIAERQHGLVSHRQAAAIGLSRNAIARRVEQGRLHRVYRGVYAVGHLQHTAEARWMGSVMACGRGSFLSHLDGAALWKIYHGEGARVHVITTSRAGRALQGLCVHRPRRLDPEDVTIKDGIPVTTVARTLVDLTDVLGRDRVLRALREADYLRLLDLDALSAAVQRAHGRKRLSVLHEALAHHTPGQIVRGELEHRFLELVRAAGLPAPETNVKVQTRRRRYVIDCLWRDQLVAVELDGRAAHARTLAFESDRRKDAALTAIGLRPLRFTWFRVTSDPGDVIAELEATLAQADARFSAA
jgi:predicted transcriptional regulator of viral defense system/very-short-patch-repair endonuclease